MGVYHNGSTTLELERLAAGILVPSGSLSERQADTRHIVDDQIRHVMLADQRGFDRVFLSEHHFEIGGVSFNPNPLGVQMLLADRTEDIRLGQLATIATWRDPIRLAEQTAMVDIVSNGRVDVGIGRGFAPRENEVLGQYWGGGIQNEEQNRASFREKIEILQQAWTEPYFSYCGEFHQIPPDHTKWHNSLDRAYLERLEDVDIADIINWSESDDPRASVMDGDSLLKAITVYPQPVQTPHPQLWQPVNSKRSMRWAARRGINAVLADRPGTPVKSLIDCYYEAAAESDWPDRRSEYREEPFKYGWDESRDRGVALYKPVFNTAIADEETADRWVRGIEHLWYWFREFFPGGLADPLDLNEAEERVLRERHSLNPEDPLRLDRQILTEKRLALIGSSEDIVNQIQQLKETYDYEDFCFIALFEASGLSGREADRQLEHFAETVLPILREKSS